MSDYPDETTLLEKLVDRGWSLFAFGEQDTTPQLIAAVNRHLFVADVIAVRGQERVTAYRSVASFFSDPLRATDALWYYAGHVAYALDQLARLAGEFGEPFPIPDECRLPELDYRPFILRPPLHAQKPTVRRSPYRRDPTPR